MPRLFVALDPPESVRAALIALRADLSGARWSAPEQMHLTLVFLGGVDEARVTGIETALADVTSGPITVALERLEAFPNRRAPHVLVARVAASPALLGLQMQIARGLGTVGITLETRPFRPHLTLARLKHPDREGVRDFLSQPCPERTFEVTAFHLYASALTPEGSHYWQIRSFALSASLR